MEGELWKWTNYWNGWQSRWFILEDGILSYYKSYDEVSQGCKGSLNISACEIVVSHNDNTRFDLIISGGEQYMYVRASNEKDRQRWLIALGSAKTCINNRPRRQRLSSSAASSGATPSDACDDSSSLKTKKSELRLYCDLLMQQVHLVKESVKPDGYVDTEHLNEATSLLPQTCDMFIKTLDEAMRLSDANFVYTLSTERVGDSAILHHHHVGSTSRKNSRSSMSQERATTPVAGSNGGHPGRRRRLSSDSIVSRISPTLQEEDETSKQASLIANSGFKMGSMSTGGFLIKQTSPCFSSVFGSNETNSESPAVAGYSPYTTPKKSSPGIVIPLEINGEDDADDVNDFIFPLRPKFLEPSEPGGDVRTSDFLSAAKGALKIYDFLGCPTFSCIKSEAENLWLSLRSKYSSNTKRFKFLGSMLTQDEFGLDPGHRDVGVALSGLTLHLMFLHNFLRRFLETNEDEVSRCLLEASDATSQQQFSPNAFASVHLDIKKASADLTLTRFRFLQNFGIFSKSVNETSISMEILQTRLFPPLADYLDSMEICLMSAVKTSGTNNINLFLL